jgi:NAD(P)H-dependent FMN reductase
MPAILAFSGSVRTGSFNQRLLEAAVPLLKEEGATVTAISLRDYPMPLYDADEEAAHGPPEAAIRLNELMAAHAGVFVACPEYNGSITPLLKNTIDQVSRVRGPGTPGITVLKDRVWALASASPGALGGLRSLMHTRHTLTYGIGAVVIPEQVAVGNAANAFSPDGSLADARQAAMLATVAWRLVAFAG